MAIHTKLLEFQKLGITLKKEGTNPHFQSKYVTLNEVLEKVKKPLNDRGIIILQNPEATGLRTTLLDTEDNSKIESFMPYVETSTAQKLGSNNTYVRRYALVTMLGLEDEDDDGNQASLGYKAQSERPAYVPTPRTPATPQPSAYRGHGVKASDKQKNFIKKLCFEKGEEEPTEGWFATLDMQAAKESIDRLLKMPTLEQGDEPTNYE